MKYFFLIGAGVSHGNTLSALKDGIDSFDRLGGPDREVFSCGFPGEEEEIVRHLINTHPGRPLRIVVCGAMENLHFAVNGQVGVSGVEIAFLPCDPDCRFDDASSGLLCADVSTVESLFPGRVVDVDLIRINERHCVSGAVFGFNLGIRAFRRRYRRWKKRFPEIRLPEIVVRRLFRLALTLFHASAKSVRICVNGHEIIEDQMAYLLFTNTRRCGEGYPEIVQAAVDDGLIDMLSVKKPPLTVLPGFVSNDPRGDLMQQEYLRGFVRHRRCITAEIELAEPTVIDMDGTLYLRDRKFIIETRPAALKMLVPDGGECEEKPLAF